MKLTHLFLCFVVAGSSSLTIAIAREPADDGPDQASPDQQAAPASAPVSIVAPPRNYLRTFAQDERTMWLSPFHRKSYDSHTVKKYVLPFALISGALLATDRRTAEILPNSLDQTKWSGRVSQVGASYSLVGLSAGSFLLGKTTGNKHLQETGWLALQAIAHTQIVVFAIKQITNRERPLTHEGKGGFWAGGDSFPSGHAATSFAVASVFAYEYRDHIVVPITAYALAGTVATSRLSAQRHWTSDVLVGGAMGFLIGRFMYKRHHDPNLPGSPVEHRSHLSPQVSFTGRSMSLGWNF